jgi:hypothetical protein
VLEQRGRKKNQTGHQMSEGLCIDNINYTPTNTTQFPAGEVCCLGRHFGTCVPSSRMVFSRNYSVM